MALAWVEHHPPTRLQTRFQTCDPERGVLTISPLLRCHFSLQWRRPTGKSHRRPPLHDERRGGGQLGGQRKAALQNISNDVPAGFPVFWVLLATSEHLRRASVWLRIRRLGVRVPPSALYRFLAETNMIDLVW